MNVPPEDGRLLRVLTEAIDATHVVEIGTSNGYSGLWLCLALQSTGGKLTTHEIDAGRAALARENFERAGVESIVTLVEGDAHETVTIPLVRPGGLIVAHNMNPRQADPRYVEAITTNPELDTILVQTQGTGVGVTLKKRG
jgi:predicted O-methyltransferase YrrM